MANVSRQLNAGAIFIVILLIVVAVLGAVFFFLTRKSSSSVTPSSVITAPSSASEGAVLKEKTPNDNNLNRTENIDKALQTDSNNKNPEEIVDIVKNALREGTINDFLESDFSRLLSDDEKEKLKAFASKSKGGDFSVRYVGVIEYDHKKRWAIKGADGAEVHLDFVRDGSSWLLNSVFFPSSENTAIANKGSDALGVADVFIRNLLTQDFEEALKFVDKTSVSDVQIAGLCIMFEEAKYLLNEDKPLNSLFLRNNLAAFTVNLVNADDLSKGQLELAMLRDHEDAPWRVSELNVQKLLSAYIDKVSGGDSYYTPLIKNPQGGDRLALFFEFNDGKLTPRAKRQLDVVASLLITSEGKKLTISGHTDAIGSDDYNKTLSLERARSVREYMTSKGLKDDQINISAFGESKPRGDNETDLGRRANRRTEIYLDF